jgi:hypothetical protein
MGGGEAVGLDGGEAVRLVGEEAVRLTGDRAVGVHKSISPHTSHRGVFWCFSGYGLNRRAPHYPQWIRCEVRLSEGGMGLYEVVVEMSR